ncbi:MAG TPA: 50S ribosomal protein L29 [Rhabdochlamydiaceae bacterium]|nr:50S ribosomal protein L29 [Rhabdochlamydiaceae bacterium]
MFKMEDLTKQSVVELKALYNDLSKEIYEINTEFSITRKLEKPHLLRSKKKDRARVLTAINQQSKSLKTQEKEKA